MKDFFKKFKMPIIVGVVILAIVIILIFVLGNKKIEGLGKIDKTQSVNKVYQLIAPEYQEIECVNDCKFFYAYKGADKLTGVIDFFNQAGTKLGSLNLSKMDPKMVAVLDIKDITNKYFIVSHMVSEKLDFKYIIYTMNNKILMEVDKAEALTDKYIMIEQDNKSSIVDNTGKLIYENVKYVKVYNDQFITFEMNGVNKIVDESGNELLSGYTIAKVVLDENDEVDYLIVKNSEDSVYSYYNIEEKLKKGDSFTSYSEVDEKIVITKKVDSKSKKFVLNSNGEQDEYKEEKQEDLDKDTYYEEIEKKVDTTKYPIFKSTVNMKDQNYILVDAKEENKFGILNVEKGEFKELASFKENSSRKLNLTKLSENDEIETDGDIIYFIKCSKYYCDNELHFVYNFSKNKLILSRDGSKESLMYSLKIYENGYYVVRNASSTYDDSSKYFLYDNEGKKLLESDYDISIIDSNVTYYTSSLKTTGQINLYSLNENKVINLKDDEVVSVTRQTFDEKSLYQFVLDDKTYLIASDGTITKLDGELKYTDDVGMYLLNDAEIIYYNVFTKQISSYELKENESRIGSNGSELNPYRNAIFVNNTYDYIVKVIGVDGKVMFEKKNVQIYNIEKQSDGSILMLVKDKNDKVGMYMVR